ncbi:hypothetical protein [Microbulbifer sp. SAOS-129_SWC]|uniref:hypothetical protein n=1 Tax=Microbulbifer sp. SAOS-129_SWC TaxID=3145235 RepID=UPI003216B6EC
METDPYVTNQTSATDTPPIRKNRLVSFLKVVLIGLGGLFAILVVIMLWAYFSTTKAHKKFDGVAEEYIQGFLREQTPWDYQKAKPTISQAWLDASTDEQNSQLFNYFNKLGSLRSVDEIAWQSCINMKLESSGPTDRCDYNVNATYEHGQAQMHFGLSREGGKIKLMQLKVNSNAFLQK